MGFKMDKALVFNIQRYSIHDGSGIRTLIFFKGCPLRCPWCSNPESQSTQREIMRKESLCIQCVSDRAKNCPKTPDFCPTNALEWVGEYMSVDEIVAEVKKDLVFYDASGGGVTLSGGEVLMQGDFIVKLLKALKALGINTAIETSGHGDYNLLLEASKYLDEILFDIKIIDNDNFRNIIKGSSELIKDNFVKLVESGVKVRSRFALIPGYTDDIDNINNIIDFLSESKVFKVDLLPFHQYGSSKYTSLDRDYELKNVNLLVDKEIEYIKTKFTDAGFRVNVSG